MLVVVIWCLRMFFLYHPILNMTTYARWCPQGRSFLLVIRAQKLAISVKPSLCDLCCCNLQQCHSHHSDTYISSGKRWVYLLHLSHLPDFCKDCLRKSAYSQTVRACRDSELCRVSPTLLQLIAMDFPQVGNSWDAHISYIILYYHIIFYGISYYFHIYLFLFPFCWKDCGKPHEFFIGYLKAILHFSSYIGSRSPQQELVCMSESAFPTDLGLSTVFFQASILLSFKEYLFFCRPLASLQGRVKRKVQNHYYSGTSNPGCWHWRGLLKSDISPSARRKFVSH